MNAERLLDHYDRACDASDSVPRLRRFVLDLAIRGKLVPQNPNDEPASQLLTRISAEKARLLKTGEIRTPKSVSALSGSPFQVPSNWRWSQIAEIGVLNPRNEAPDSVHASFVPMPLIPAEYGAANQHEVRPWSEIKKGYTHFCEGDVGVAKITPCFENGKSTIFARLSGGIGAGTTELHIVRPIFVDANYLLIFLKSPHFIETGIPKMTGTAGQKRIPLEYFAYSAFPVPPVAEQQRIVAKVGELMALCNRLEAARSEREANRDRFTTANLARLNAADPNTFEADARFTLDTLPVLTARADQIKQLRHTILNLAVRGKLVPQDSKEEPASQLLSQIAGEKAKLIETGDLKKDKEFWDGLPASPPHDVPPNWRWARLQDLFEVSRGGSPRPAGDPQFFGGAIPWITVQEITKDADKYLVKTHSGLTKEGEKRSRVINPGDLLLTNSGATLGVPKISRIRGCINDGVAVLRTFHSILPNDFAYLYLQSQTNVFRTINQGMGQPNLNTSIIAGWFIPVPPLGEQLRITAKVDELMALCARMENSIAAADETRRRLLEALLADGLASDNAREAAIE